MFDTKLQQHLGVLNACSEAREFASTKTARETWEQCVRPDWLLWWSARTPANTRENIVRCAAQIARTVLHLIPAGEDRPRLAIEAAEKYAKHPTTENGAAAYAAARAVYAVYAADAAAYAVYAAVYAADAAAYAVYAAADAVYAAVYAAAYAASRGADAVYAAARQEQCNLIRGILVLPWSE